jgi:hypothetical protein
MCCFRLRFDAIERLIFLTEFFTWEELPNTDPETGSLMMAGWIPRLQKITSSILLFLPIFVLTSTISRAVMLAKRPLPYNTWYPFDTSFTPTYELITITQVMIYYK